jgi:hypothetical protein
MSRQLAHFVPNIAGGIAHRFQLEKAVEAAVGHVGQLVPAQVQLLQGKGQLVGGEADEPVAFELKGKWEELLQYIFIDWVENVSVQ